MKRMMYFNIIWVKFVELYYRVMVKSKAIELLRTFTKSEIKEFDKFLKSPYHNVYETVIKTYSIVIKFYPGFDNEKLDYKYIFSRLYKNKKYNEALVRNVLSDLLKAEEDFLAHSALKASPLEKHRLVNNELINKNLFTHFSKNLKKAIISLENCERNDVEYFYYKHSYLLQSYTVSQIITHEYEDTFQYFTEAEKPLAEYVAVLLSNFYMPVTSFDFTSINTNEIKKINPLLYNTTLDIFSHVDKNSNEVIQTFYFYYMLYSTRKNEYYFLLKNNVKKYEKRFEQATLREFYIMLHNFCLDKFNLGDKDFSSEYNEILDIFIEKEYFTRPGSKYISQPGFRNVIIMKVKLKDFDGAMEFAEGHYKKLAPEVQESNYYYSTAFICFYLKKYEESVKNLGKVKYDEYLLKLQTENLMLQNYYELGYEEESLYKIDALIHYMNLNKRIPENYLLLYSAFAACLKKLILCKNNKQNDSIAQKNVIAELKKEIESGSMTSKAWLLEKISEF